MNGTAEESRISSETLPQICCRTIADSRSKMQRGFSTIVDLDN